MNVNLTAKRERFCQLIAQGTMKQWECYQEAYHSIARRTTMHTEAYRLMKNPDVIARVEQIRRPVIAKVRKVFKYEIEDALADCQAAEDLAKAMLQPNVMLQAAKLKSQLGKLLVSVSESRTTTPLDEASTEELLSMLEEARKKKLAESVAVEKGPGLRLVG